MGFFEDTIGNIGTFLGINPDTKKKPQILPPTNTLRQQAVRPTQNISAPIANVDTTASIRAQAVANNQAEIDRKKREEAARQAALAQQARQVQQTAPIVPVAVTPNRVPINSLGLPATPTQPIGVEQKKQAIVEQVRRGITPSNVPINYVLKNNTPLSKSDFNAALLEGSKQKIEDKIGTPFERAQAQVGGIDLTSMAQALARIPETAVRSGAEVLDNLITHSGASYSNDNKNEGLLRTLYGRDGIKTYGRQGAEGKKALQSSDLGFLKDTGNTLPPELIATVLAALDLPILKGVKVAGGLGVKATKLAITTATNAVRKQTEEAIGRELTKAELKEIANRTKEVVTNVPEQPVSTSTTLQTDVNGYKPISNNAVNGLVKGGPGAAINILRASGRRLNPDVERALAEQLSYAKTPEQVNDVLKNAGIPVQETPAQALARQKASGEQVATEQTKALENASTPVVAQEPVPAAANGIEQKAAPSADIAQNDVAPQVTKTPKQPPTQAVDQAAPVGKTVDLDNDVSLYHGSRDRVDTFDLNHLNATYMHDGLGVNFTDNKDFAKLYSRGKNQWGEINKFDDGKGFINERTIPKGTKVLDVSDKSKKVSDILSLDDFKALAKKGRDTEYARKNLEKLARNKLTKLEDDSRVIAKQVASMSNDQLLDIAYDGLKSKIFANGEGLPDVFRQLIDVYGIKTADVADVVRQFSKQTGIDVIKTSKADGSSVYTVLNPDKLVTKAPQVTKTPADQLAEAHQTPIDKRTPEQTAEITRLEGEAKTAKDASDFLAVKQKLENNEPLTPKEERIYQKVMGTPQEKGAIKRALTPEEQRISEPRTPENPALNMVDGKVKVLKKGGKAADNKAQFQEALTKEGNDITSRADDYFRANVNIAKSIEQDAPEIGKHVQGLRARNSAAAAEQVRGTQRGQEIGDDVFSGLNKADEQRLQYHIENYSNKKLTNKLKAEDPVLYEKVTKAREYFQGQLDTLNKVLVDYGEKPIGNIKDYFPRMQKYLSDKNSPIRSMLLDDTQSSAAYGEARLSKGFQKERTLEQQASKPLTPHDAFQVYVRQSEGLISRLPVVKDINNFKKIVEETDINNLPAPAKKQLVDLFDNMNSQLTGANRPTTGAAKTAATLGNIASKSGVAFSVNTALTQLTAPVSLLVRRVTDAGLIKGTASTIGIIGRAIRNAKYVGKDAAKMTKIDGMESDYLVSALGHKAPKKNKGQRFVDAGYKSAAYGDIQYRSAAVEQVYNDAVKAGAPRGKETLLKAEDDVRMALADRTAGERSKFTSSGNAVAQLASKYQVEQVQQVYNFIDGVILNKKAGPWRKVAGTLAAVGGAYGLNSLTGAISGGTVKPLPDIYGAGVDAFATIQQQNEDRIANGEDPLTSEQQAAIFLANMGSNYISNLPLGRTALSVASAGVNGLTGSEDTAKTIGLNPKDTNPFQTLPAIGAVTSIGKDVSNIAQGKVDPVTGALTIASRVVPGGGQARRTAEGTAAFIQGGDSFAPNTDQKAAGEKGDVKFKINNDLSTGEGIANLVRSVVFGKYSTDGGQAYIDSGFKKQSERDVKNKTYTDAEVSQLTKDQVDSYSKAVKGRFGQTLNDKERALYKIIKNGDEVNRQINAGKLTDDEVQNLKAKMNKDLYNNGLGYTIDNGYNSDAKGREQFKNFSPELQQFITKKSIESAKAFKMQDASDEAKAVIALATAPDEAWPTVTDVKATNALADKYVTYQKALSEAGDDQAAQFTARKSFWSAAVKQNFDSKAVGIYDNSDDGGTTNSKATYGMSIANIKKLASTEGLTVGKDNYKINKTDLDSMVELDNRLLKAGLISKPKFSNKTRGAFGYGDAPTSEIDGLGYVDGTGSGKGSDRTGVGSLLTSYGGKSIKGFSDLPNKQTSTPKLDISQFQNTAKRAGKSSITIKL